MSDAEYLAANEVVESVRSAFPEEAKVVEASLVEDFLEDAPHIFLERFAQLTTDLIKAGDFINAKMHLKLVSDILRRGDSDTVRCIDVAYVESLMWDISDENRKRQGWALFPENLRELYVALWGEKPFMERT